MNKNQFFRVILSSGFFLITVHTTFAQTATKNYMDIPVMLTPSPVMLTPIRDDGLREL